MITGMDFACRSLWGPVDNVTLPDTIYKGVALCGWDEIGLWSICSSEKNKPVERNGTANVERIFLEGECFICTRSAPKADDMKGNWIRYLGNSFPHWLAKLWRQRGYSDMEDWLKRMAILPLELRLRAETRIACPSDRDSWDTHLQVSGLVV